MKQYVSFALIFNYLLNKKKWLPFFTSVVSVVASEKKYVFSGKEPHQKLVTSITRDSCMYMS